MSALALAAVSTDDSIEWAAGGGWRCLCRRCTCRRCLGRPRCGPIVAGKVQTIDPGPHRDWAENIARLIARHKGFGPRSQEADDLVAVAYLTLIELSLVFDPSRVPDGGDEGGQFRGWSHPWIRNRCERETKRLRNGGTYHSRREKGQPVLRIVPLPRCRNCSEVTLAETPRAWWGDDEE
jgi:hypothetical protein